MQCPSKDSHLINALVAKVFGTKNERELKRLMPRVEAINALEPATRKLSDEQLRAKTDEFRQRIQERLTRIPDEPDADPDRRKELDTERSGLVKEVLDELLVEAFAVVRDQLSSHPLYKDLRLIIIGDTISQYPSVRQAVIKSRAESVVRFLGFVPFDTLRCFYEAASAFVFVSRYEGFGLPPLEAMACGTPVVTSNVSSLPEVVGDSAVQVNPENVFEIARGIKEVLLDEELRTTLIRCGREQARRFSWERTAREVLEIYHEACASVA